MSVFLLKIAEYTLTHCPISWDHLTHAIMRATGKSKTCVWRWQERFMEAGIDGLLRDKTRPPGIAPIEDVRVRDIVALTLIRAGRCTSPRHQAHG